MIPIPARFIFRQHRVVLVAALAWCASTPCAQGQGPAKPWLPTRQDTSTKLSVYPVGDAVDVYRAVFDLYFIDGEDRPKVIVMHDTAEAHSSEACVVGCPEAWMHKSKIDNNTIMAFSSAVPRGRPRTVAFGYPIPIVFLSWEDEQKLREAGAARLKAEHRESYIEEEKWATEFSRRYPGAWGFIRMSKVSFDDAHTEALIEVAFTCGVSCRSSEIVFLRKLQHKWTVVERIPSYSEGMRPSGAMRYRGPAGSTSLESEVLAPALARDKSSHSEGDDAIAVYQTVLDSLYSFRGETPLRIVVTDWFPVDRVGPATELPKHLRPIQPSTAERYKSLREATAPLYGSLHTRAPASRLPRDQVQEMERVGGALQKAATSQEEMTEAPFWLEFKHRYPGAWGMVGFTRAAFNDDRTQALVFTSHTCGLVCRNDDTWLVERTGEKWHVAERIPRFSNNHWVLEPLRYLGADADPHAYRTRRVRGVLVSKMTGRPLANRNFWMRSPRDSSVMTTDAGGRFVLDDLPPEAAYLIMVDCEGYPMRRRLLVSEFVTHPGIDSSMSIPVDLRRCIPHRKAHPLTGGKPSPEALTSTFPDAQDAAVYNGLFNELYRLEGLILLLPRVRPFWEFEFDSELFRLARQGLVDSTMQPRLKMLPRDSVWFRPGFSSRRLIILGPGEQKFLREQGDEFAEYEYGRDVSLAALAKEAYPGADGVLSLSRVAYNASQTQAIVQLSMTGSGNQGRLETVILHEIRGSWHVVRRHVESEETSGAMVNGRCEPVDAPHSSPTLAQMERFVGDADITVITTAPELRGESGTAHYRFTPTDTLHRFYWLPPKGDKRAPIRMTRGQKLATVQTFDSADTPMKRRDGELAFSPAGTTLTFIEDPNTFDGAMEQFKILGVNGRQFFGTWYTQSGPTYPWKGYFCGRLR